MSTIGAGEILEVRRHQGEGGGDHDQVAGASHTFRGSQRQA